MREIKFRAWDNDEKKMYGCVKQGNGIRDIQFGQYGEILNITIFKYLESGDFEFNNLISEDSEFELMQYTGLKDKNGVEIYESDIVKADCRGSNTNGCLYEIKYDNINACFYGNPLHRQKIGKILECKHAQPMSEIRQNIEVIGNIYENPELLEKKDD